MKKKKLLLVKNLATVADIAHRAHAAAWGIGADSDAVMFVSYWKDALAASPPERFALSVKSEDSTLRMMFVELLEPKITQSVRTGDGTFLRQLAEAIERSGKPLDRVRSTIGYFAWLRKIGFFKQNYPKTASECYALVVRDLDQPLDFTLFRRYAKEMGLEFEPDRKGRKPSSKLKLKKAN